MVEAPCMICILINPALDVKPVRTAEYCLQNQLEGCMDDERQFKTTKCGAWPS